MSPVQGETAKDIYDELVSKVSEFTVATSHGISYIPNALPGRGDAVWLTCAAEIQCTTTCLPFSDFASADGRQDTKNVKNYFLFKHDIQCTPYDQDSSVPLKVGVYPVRTQPRGYQIRVRYLNKKDGNFQAILDSPVASPGENFDLNTLEETHFLRSVPEQTQSLVNYSKSISTSMSASAGFFGDSPTSTASETTSVSSSVSFSVPSVDVTDRSFASHINKVFNLNDDSTRKGTFQMTVQHLVEIADDQKGSRIPGKAGQEMRHFEIQIWPGTMGWSAGRSDQDILGGVTVTYGPTPNLGPFFNGPDESYTLLQKEFKVDANMGTMGPRQIITIPAPPLPNPEGKPKDKPATGAHGK